MPGSVPDMPGIKADEHLAGLLQREVASLLNRDRTNFPGAQPVSFARSHIEELCKEDYYLCEKTDGIRCLLFCTIDEHANEIHYLIDRKNDYYFVPGLHFPHHTDPNFAKFHSDTLIDGELVIDTYPDGRRVNRYLVFDCLVLDKECLTSRPLDKRIGRFAEFVDKPLKALYHKFPAEVKHFPFEVRFKAMDKPYALEAMFNEKLPTLPHGNDGLVFTCKGTPYVNGTDQHILKWKPAEENTIDFKLRLGDFPLVVFDDNTRGPDYAAKPSFELLIWFGGDRHEHYGYLTVTDQEWEILKSLGEVLDGRIIECYRTEQGKWHYKAESNGGPRFRDDKEHANHESVAKSVMESILDGVSKEDLIRAAPAIHRAWKHRHPEEEAQKRAMAQRGAPPSNGHMNGR
ncbi:hypothetical protein BLS_006510 [Venturia inaequalis]|uniref:mRNA-capping enzyme subunit alpha n=1 Tax=Venturia inaequalis TaxID=5025 RepID=A0A8H3UCX1_VENIN|nr:hypothetical protein BLS_006510 [Venturia inaequalis]RDI79071.1 hypothetical protein Vi05172_g10878 [Venturia inaequalis]